MSSSNTLASEISQAQTEALTAIASASDAAGLRSVQADLSGKKSALTVLRSQLGKIQDAEERKAAGQAINACAQTIEAAIGERMSLLLAGERAQQVASEAMDLSEFVTAKRRGSTHIVTQATQRLEDVFIGLGFQVAEGPEVETDFYNFEALNMPPSHPARSMHDTFYVDHGTPGSTVLRTHTSPVQIRVMQTIEPPIYMVMPGRVFRNETTDATHLAVFHQIEGLVIDRGITLADLAGTIDSFTKAFFGTDFGSRLRPSYFPFTEPSAEFDIRTPKGDWLELGGCGMVHPNVLRAGGLDPEEWSGFAFGFGIDRMAKERHGVGDVREMYTNDIRFIEQF